LTHDVNGPAILKIKGLNYQINNINILKDISLEAVRGEFIGLIGPNGAGKTTLLKCINGICRGSGCVELDGTDISMMTARQTASRVAMLHQDTSVAFPFKVMDVVLTGRYHRLGRFRPESAEDYEAARRYMGYTDTLKLENRMINTLSGGERQRVLFAKALAQETDLILLDEPSASLDIAYEEQVFKYSEDICRNGKTVIAAVHDLKTAVRYCSRLVLMKDGRIIADGPPESVITRDNLRLAYGVNALVYRNRITGLVDFHLSGGGDSKRGIRVHVIGGGGSASGVIRQLFEAGYTVTAGVFSHGDSDLGCADVFGIKALACKPFSEIDDDTLNENIDLVKTADMTILCDMPFGHQNIRNLEAASYAASLVIIEDGEPGARDFTGGEALAVYNGLKKKAVTVNSARLHEVLP
jgi:iron complex transport system ATP-binding protein